MGITLHGVPRHACCDQITMLRSQALEAIYADQFREYKGSTPSDWPAAGKTYMSAGLGGWGALSYNL